MVLMWYCGCPHCVHTISGMHRLYCGSCMSINRLASISKRIATCIVSSESIATEYHTSDSERLHTTIVAKSIATGFHISEANRCKQCK